MCILIVCLPSGGAIKFEINVIPYISLIQVVFSTRLKIQDKNNILRTKKAFKMKWKTFFINFEGLSLKLIKQSSWKVRIRL